MLEEHKAAAVAITFAELSESEKWFAAFTLLASRCGREKRYAAMGFYDRAKFALYDGSEKAYAAYHLAYTMWRDSGFNPAMFSMLTHFLGRRDD